MHETHSFIVTFRELSICEQDTKGREEGRTNASWKNGKGFRKEGICDLSPAGGGGVYQMKGTLGRG